MDLKYRLIIVTTIHANTESGTKGFYRVDWQKADGAEGTKDITRLADVHTWINERCNSSVNCRVLWR